MARLVLFVVPPIVLALCEAAERALLTLFGPLVALEATRSPGAWRDALAERDFDPALRYRHGQPWTPGLVVEDCGLAAPPHTKGARSQRDIERWLDEIGARTGVPVDADLAPWTPQADLGKMLGRALRVRWPPGAWTGPRRELDRRRR